MFFNPYDEIPPLKEEDFKLFHSIDRELFRKLVIDLRRDTAESMRVMALWMWLEQLSTGGLTTVKKMLSLPYPVIDQLFNESIVCLNYAGTPPPPPSSSSSSSGNKVFWGPDHHYHHHEMAEFELKLLPELLGRNVDTKFFYDHRVLVLEGVTRLCTQVCSRAFQDIIVHDLHHDHQNYNHNLPINYNDPFSTATSSSYWGGGGWTPVLGGHDDHEASVPFSYGWEVPPPLPSSSSMAMFNNQYAMLFPPMVDHQNLNRLLMNMNNLNLEQQKKEKEEEVDPEDRTIFITFSKGYPIAEPEVRDFFTRLYGDFIEEIRMQQVGAGEQVLYARMVCRKASAIDTVVRGGKTKYNINGKHVCVRKFVKKKNNNQSSSSFSAAARRRFY